MKKPLIIRFIISYTMLLATAAMAMEEDFIPLDGVWSTPFGDVTLTTQGDVVQGQYGKGRKIIAQFTPETANLQGYWFSPTTSHPCKTSKNGTQYWGQLQWTFSDTTPPTFQGKWNYCEQALTRKWQGKLKKVNPLSAIQARYLLLDDKRDLSLAKAALVQLHACYQVAETDADIAILCDETFNTQIAELQPHTSEIAKIMPAKVSHQAWNEATKQNTLATQKHDLQALTRHLHCLDKGANTVTLKTCITPKSEFTKVTPQNVSKANQSDKSITQKQLQNYKNALSAVLPAFERANICYQSAGDLHIANVCKQMYFDAVTAYDKTLSQVQGVPNEQKKFMPHSHWNQKQQQIELSQVVQYLDTMQWYITCIDKGANFTNLDTCVNHRGKF